MFDVFRKKLTVRSSPGGFDETGIWVDQPPVERQITASLQPLDDDILDTLPEGYRTKESYLLISDSYLNLASVGNSRADIVEVEWSWYQVVSVKNWKSLSGFSFNYNDHCEAIIVKMDDDSVNQ